MGEDRSVKKAYLERPFGRRPIGRPIYRYTDTVLVDLRELQVHSWQQAAQDG